MEHAVSTPSGNGLTGNGVVLNVKGAMCCGRKETDADDTVTIEDGRITIAHSKCGSTWSHDIGEILEHHMEPLDAEACKGVVTVGPPIQYVSRVAKLPGSEGK